MRAYDWRRPVGETKLVSRLEIVQQTNARRRSQSGEAAALFLGAWKSLPNLLVVEQTCASDSYPGHSSIRTPNWRPAKLGHTILRPSLARVPARPQSLAGAGLCVAPLGPARPSLIWPPPTSQPARMMRPRVFTQDGVILWAKALELTNLGGRAPTQGPSRPANGPGRPARPVANSRHGPSGATSGSSRLSRRQRNKRSPAR